MDLGRSPFFHDGMLAFNREKWGLRSERVRYPEADGRLESVLYLNRRGQVVLPRLNPYLPVQWDAAAEHPPSAYRAWALAGGAFARDLRRRGIAGTLAFSSDVRDLRPWQWQGFRVGVRYTLIQSLPFEPHVADADNHRRVRRAATSGYRCERTLSFTDALAAIKGTETRQGFRYGLDVDDLGLLQSTLGDSLRVYVAYASDGRPASARIVLYEPGGAAVDWANGTVASELKSGATHLLMRYMLDDLSAAGATAMDWEGANISSIANAKERWGGALERWFTVERFAVSGLLRWIHGQWRYR